MMVDLQDGKRFVRDSEIWAGTANYWVVSDMPKQISSIASIMFLPIPSVSPLSVT